jgi:hypothetical protein
MNTKEIKAMLKPLIKQCIKEVLLEEGLGKVISEVKSTPAVEPKAVVKKQPVVESKVHSENRKKLIDEIGKSGYLNNKFDPFANTKPLTEAQASGAPTGPMSNVEPTDPGVDISSLLSGNKDTWKVLAKGKAK